MQGKPQKIESEAMRDQVIRVPPIQFPVRLDRFLSTLNPELPKRRLRLALRDSVLVNGRHSKKGNLLFGNEEIVLPAFWRLSVLPNPELKLPVLYEDDYLIALDKPAQIQCHPLWSSDVNTVANFVAAHEPECTRIGGRMEAGLVHRLDAQTSGLLLAAKDKLAFQRLRQQFSNGRVVKKYIGLCVGQVPGDRTIDLPLAHSTSDRRKMVIARPGCKKTQKSWEARTEVHVINTYANHTLISLTIRTGVTHQIRVHLASLGHPLLGERLYACPRDTLGLERHFLHASRLTLDHPMSGQRLQLESPLPEELRKILARLTQSDRSSPNQETPEFVI